MKLGNNPLFSPLGKIFIIPDIQGDSKKLESLWNKISLEIKKEDHLVFLGDYIGSNCSNLNTLILLQKIKNSHHNTFFICGNHDDSFLNYLKSKHQKSFLDKDLISKEIIERGYANGEKDKIILFLKERNIDFIYNMIPYYETKDLICTHAPFSHFSSNLYSRYEGLLEDMEFDLMNDFLDPDEENIPIKGIDKWLICGHQNNGGERKYPSIYPESKRIFMDTGCGYFSQNKLFSIVMPFKRVISSD